MIHSVVIIKNFSMMVYANINVYLNLFSYIFIRWTIMTIKNLKLFFKWFKNVQCKATIKFPLLWKAIYDSNENIYTSLNSNHPPYIFYLKSQQLIHVIIIYFVIYFNLILARLTYLKLLCNILSFKFLARFLKILNFLSLDV